MLRAISACFRFVAVFSTALSLILSPALDPILRTLDLTAFEAHFAYAEGGCNEIRNAKGDVIGATNSGSCKGKCVVKGEDAVCQLTEDTSEKDNVPAQNPTPGPSPTSPSSPNQPASPNYQGQLDAVNQEILTRSFDVRTEGDAVQNELKNLEGQKKVLEQLVELSKNSESSTFPNSPQEDAVRDQHLKDLGAELKALQAQMPNSDGPNAFTPNSLHGNSTFGPSEAETYANNNLEKFLAGLDGATEFIVENAKTALELLDKSWENMKSGLALLTGGDAIEPEALLTPSPGDPGSSCSTSKFQCEKLNPLKEEASNLLSGCKQSDTGLQCSKQTLDRIKDLEKSYNDQVKANSEKLVCSNPDNCALLDQKINRFQDLMPQANSAVSEKYKEELANAINKEYQKLGIAPLTGKETFAELQQKADDLSLKRGQIADAFMQKYGDQLYVDKENNLHLLKQDAKLETQFNKDYATLQGVNTEITKQEQQVMQLAPEAAKAQYSLFSSSQSEKADNPQEVLKELQAKSQEVASSPALQNDPKNLKEYLAAVDAQAQLQKLQDVGGLYVMNANELQQKSLEMLAHDRAEKQTDPVGYLTDRNDRAIADLQNKEIQASKAFERQFPNSQETLNTELKTNPSVHPLDKAEIDSLLKRGITWPGLSDIKNTRDEISQLQKENTFLQAAPLDMGEKFAKATFGLEEKIKLGGPDKAFYQEQLKQLKADVASYEDKLLAQEKREQGLGYQMLKNLPGTKGILSLYDLSEKQDLSALEKRISALSDPRFANTDLYSKAVDVDHDEGRTMAQLKATGLSEEEIKTFASAQALLESKVNYAKSLSQNFLEADATTILSKTIHGVGSIANFMNEGETGAALFNPVSWTEGILQSGANLLAIPTPEYLELQQKGALTQIFVTTLDTVNVALAPLLFPKGAVEPLLTSAESVAVRNFLAADSNVFGRGAAVVDAQGSVKALSELEIGPKNSSPVWGVQDQQAFATYREAQKALEGVGIKIVETDSGLALTKGDNILAQKPELGKPFELTPKTTQAIVENSSIPFSRADASAQGAEVQKIVAANARDYEVASAYSWKKNLDALEAQGGENAAIAKTLRDGNILDPKVLTESQFSSISKWMRDTGYSNRLELQLARDASRSVSESEIASFTNRTNNAYLDSIGGRTPESVRLSSTELEKVSGRLAEDVRTGALKPEEVVPTLFEYRQRVFENLSGLAYRDAQNRLINIGSQGNNVTVKAAGGKTVAILALTGEDGLRLGQLAQREILVKYSPTGDAAKQYVEGTMNNGTKHQDLARAYGYRLVDGEKLFKNGAQNGHRDLRAALNDSKSVVVWSPETRGHAINAAYANPDLMSSLRMTNIARIDEVHEFATNPTRVIIADNTSPLTRAELNASRADAFLSVAGHERPSVFSEVGNTRLANLERVEIKPSENAAAEFAKAYYADAKAYIMYEGRPILNKAAIDYLSAEHAVPGIGNVRFDPLGADSGMIGSILSDFEKMPRGVNSYVVEQGIGENSRLIYPTNAAEGVEYAQVSRNTDVEIARARRHGLDPLESVRVSNTLQETTFASLFRENPNALVTGFSGTTEGISAQIASRAAAITEDVTVSRLTRSLIGSVFTDEKALMKVADSALTRDNVLFTVYNDPAKVAELSARYGDRAIVFDSAGLSYKGTRINADFNDVIKLGRENVLGLQETGNVFIVNARGFTGFDYQGSFTQIKMGEIPRADLLAQEAERVARPGEGGALNPAKRYTYFDPERAQTNLAYASQRAEDYRNALSKLGDRGEGLTLFESVLKGESLRLADQVILDSKLAMARDISSSIDAAIPEAVNGFMRTQPLQDMLLDARITAGPARDAVEASLRKALNESNPYFDLTPPRELASGVEARNALVSGARDSVSSKALQDLSQLERAIAADNSIAAQAVRERIAQARETIAEAQAVKVAELSSSVAPLRTIDSAQDLLASARGLADQWIPNAAARPAESLGIAQSTLASTERAIRSGSIADLKTAWNSVRELYAAGADFAKASPAISALAQANTLFEAQQALAGVREEFAVNQVLLQENVRELLSGKLSEEEGRRALASIISSLDFLDKNSLTLPTYLNSVSVQDALASGSVREAQSAIQGSLQNEKTKLKADALEMFGILASGSYAAAPAPLVINLMLRAQNVAELGDATGPLIQSLSSIADFSTAQRVAENLFKNSSQAKNLLASLDGRNSDTESKIAALVSQANRSTLGQRFVDALSGVRESTELQLSRFVPGRKSQNSQESADRPLLADSSKSSGNSTGASEPVPETKQADAGTQKPSAGNPSAQAPDANQTDASAKPQTKPNLAARAVSALRTAGSYVQTALPYALNVVAPIRSVNGNRISIVNPGKVNAVANAVTFVGGVFASSIVGPIGYAAWPGANMAINYIANTQLGAKIASRLASNNKPAPAKVAAAPAAESKAAQAPATSVSQNPASTLVSPPYIFSFFKTIGPQLSQSSWNRVPDGLQLLIASTPGRSLITKIPVTAVYLYFGGVGPAIAVGAGKLAINGIVAGYRSWRNPSNNSTSIAVNNPAQSQGTTAITPETNSTKEPESQAQANGTTKEPAASPAEVQSKQVANAPASENATAQKKITPAEEQSLAQAYLDAAVAYTTSEDVARALGKNAHDLQGEIDEANKRGMTPDEKRIFQSRTDRMNASLKDANANLQLDRLAFTRQINNLYTRAAAHELPSASGVTLGLEMQTILAVDGAGPSAYFLEAAERYTSSLLRDKTQPSVVTSGAKPAYEIRSKNISAEDKALFDLYAARADALDALAGTETEARGRIRSEGEWKSAYKAYYESIDQVMDRGYVIRPGGEIYTEKGERAAVRTTPRLSPVSPLLALEVIPTSELNSSAIQNLETLDQRVPEDQVVLYRGLGQDWKSPSLSKSDMTALRRAFEKYVSGKVLNDPKSMSDFERSLWQEYISAITSERPQWFTDSAKAAAGFGRDGVVVRIVLPLTASSLGSFIGLSRGMNIFGAAAGTVGAGVDIIPNEWFAWNTAPKAVKLTAKDINARVLAGANKTPCAAAGSSALSQAAGTLAGIDPCSIADAPKAIVDALVVQQGKASESRVPLAADMYQIALRSQSAVWYKNAAAKSDAITKALDTSALRDAAFADQIDELRALKDSYDSVLNTIETEDPVQLKGIERTIGDLDGKYAQLSADPKLAALFTGPVNPSGSAPSPFTGFLTNFRSAIARMAFGVMLAFAPVSENPAQAQTPQTEINQSTETTQQGRFSDEKALAYRQVIAIGLGLKVEIREFKKQNPDLPIDDEKSLKFYNAELSKTLAQLDKIELGKDSSTFKAVYNFVRAFMEKEPLAGLVYNELSLAIDADNERLTSGITDTSAPVEIEEKLPALEEARRDVLKAAENVQKAHTAVAMFTDKHGTMDTLTIDTPLMDSYDVLALAYNDALKQFESTQLTYMKIITAGSDTQYDAFGTYSPIPKLAQTLDALQQQIAFHTNYIAQGNTPSAEMIAKDKANKLAYQRVLAAIDRVSKFPALTVNTGPVELKDSDFLKNGQNRVSLNMIFAETAPKLSFYPTELNQRPEPIRDVSKLSTQQRKEYLTNLLAKLQTTAQTMTEEAGHQYYPATLSSALPLSKVAGFNAFYNQQQNAVLIPLSIFDLPSLSPREKILFIQSVMAHELGHHLQNLAGLATLGVYGLQGNTIAERQADMLAGALLARTPGLLYAGEQKLTADLETKFAAVVAEEINPSLNFRYGEVNKHPHAQQRVSDLFTGTLYPDLDAILATSEDLITPRWADTQGPDPNPSIVKANEQKKTEKDIKSRFGDKRSENTDTDATLLGVLRGEEPCGSVKVGQGTLAQLAGAAFAASDSAPCQRLVSNISVEQSAPTTNETSRFGRFVQSLGAILARGYARSDLSARAGDEWQTELVIERSKESGHIAFTARAADGGQKMTIAELVPRADGAGYEIFYNEDPAVPPLNSEASAKIEELAQNPSFAGTINALREESLSLSGKVFAPLSIDLDAKLSPTEIERNRSGQNSGKRIAMFNPSDLSMAVYVRARKGDVLTTVSDLWNRGYAGLYEGVLPQEMVYLKAPVKGPVSDYTLISVDGSFIPTDYSVADLDSNEMSAPIKLNTFFRRAADSRFLAYFRLFTATFGLSVSPGMIAAQPLDVPAAPTVTGFSPTSIAPSIAKLSTASRSTSVIGQPIEEGYESVAETTFIEKLSNALSYFSPISQAQAAAKECTGNNCGGHKYEGVAMAKIKQLLGYTDSNPMPSRTGRGGEKYAVYKSLGEWVAADVIKRQAYITEGVKGIKRDTFALMDSTWAVADPDHPNINKGDFNDPSRAARRSAIEKGFRAAGLIAADGKLTAEDVNKKIDPDDIQTLIKISIAVACAEYSQCDPNFVSKTERELAVNILQRADPAKKLATAPTQKDTAKTESKPTPQEAPITKVTSGKRDDVAPKTATNQVAKKTQSTPVAQPLNPQTEKIQVGVKKYLDARTQVTFDRDGWLPEGVLVGDKGYVRVIRLEWKDRPFRNVLRSENSVFVQHETHTGADSQATEILRNIQSHINSARGSNVYVPFYVSSVYKDSNGKPFVVIYQIAPVQEDSKHAKNFESAGPGVEVALLLGQTPHPLQGMASMLLADAVKSWKPGIKIVGHQGTEGTAIADLLNNREVRLSSLSNSDKEIQAQRIVTSVLEREKNLEFVLAMIDNGLAGGGMQKLRELTADQLKGWQDQMLGDGTYVARVQGLLKANGLANTKIAQQISQIPTNTAGIQELQKIAANFPAPTVVLAQTPPKIEQETKPTIDFSKRVLTAGMIPRNNTTGPKLGPVLSEETKPQQALTFADLLVQKGLIDHGDVVTLLEKNAEGFTHQITTPPKDGGNEPIVRKLKLIPGIKTTPFVIDPKKTYTMAELRKMTDVPGLKLFLEATDKGTTVSPGKNKSLKNDRFITGSALVIITSALEEYYKLFGETPVINGIGRSEAVNESVGGAENSIHLSGNAIDFCTTSCSGIHNGVQKRLALIEILRKKSPQELVVESHGEGPHTHVAFTRLLTKTEVALLAMPRFESVQYALFDVQGNQIGQNFALDGAQIPNTTLADAKNTPAPQKTVEKTEPLPTQKPPAISGKRDDGIANPTQPAIAPTTFAETSEPPTRFFFTTNSDQKTQFSAENILALTKQYGNNILIGGNPNQEGWEQLLKTAQTANAKTDLYLFGPAGPTDGTWTKEELAERKAAALSIVGPKLVKSDSKLETDAELEARAIREWEGGKWVDWNFKRVAEENARIKQVTGNPNAKIYSVEFDNLDRVYKNNPQKLAEFVQRYAQWAADNNVATKLRPKNLSIEEWKALVAQVRESKTITASVLLNFAVSEEAIPQATKTAAADIGITVVRTTNTNNYRSPQDSQNGRIVEMGFEADKQAYAIALANFQTSQKLAKAADKNAPVVASNFTSEASIRRAVSGWLREFESPFVHTSIDLPESPFLPTERVIDLEGFVPYILEIHIEPLVGWDKIAQTPPAIEVKYAFAPADRVDPDYFEREEENTNARIAIVEDTKTSQTEDTKTPETAPQVEPKPANREPNENVMAQTDEAQNNLKTSKTRGLTPPATTIEATEQKTANEKTPTEIVIPDLPSVILPDQTALKNKIQETEKNTAVLKSELAKIPTQSTLESMKNDLRAITAQKETAQRTGNTAEKTGGKEGMRIMGTAVSQTEEAINKAQAFLNTNSQYLGDSKPQLQAYITTMKMALKEMQAEQDRFTKLPDINPFGSGASKNSDQDKYKSLMKEKGAEIAFAATQTEGSIKKTLTSLEKATAGLEAKKQQLAGLEKRLSELKEKERNPGFIRLTALTWQLTAPYIRPPGSIQLPPILTELASLPAELQSKTAAKVAVNTPEIRDRVNADEVPPVKQPKVPLTLTSAEPPEAPPAQTPAPANDNGPAPQLPAPSAPTVGNAQNTTRTSSNQSPNTPAQSSGMGPNTEPTRGSVQKPSTLERATPAVPPIFAVGNSGVPGPYMPMGYVVPLPPDGSSWQLVFLPFVAHRDDEGDADAKNPVAGSPDRPATEKSLSHSGVVIPVLTTIAINSPVPASKIPAVADEETPPEKKETVQPQEKTETKVEQKLPPDVGGTVPVKPEASTRPNAPETHVDCADNGQNTDCVNDKALTPEEKATRDKELEKEKSSPTPQPETKTGKTPTPETKTSPTPETKTPPVPDTKTPSPGPTSPGTTPTPGPTTPPNSSGGAGGNIFGALSQLLGSLMKLLGLGQLQAPQNSAPSAPATASTTTISATPSSIVYGATTLLEWQLADSRSCSIYESPLSLADSLGTKLLTLQNSGRVASPPLATSTLFSLVCDGATKASAQVQVGPASSTWLLVK